MLLKYCLMTVRSRRSAICRTRSVFPNPTVTGDVFTMKQAWRSRRRRRIHSAFSRRERWRCEGDSSFENNEPMYPAWQAAIFFG